MRENLELGLSSVRDRPVVRRERLERDRGYIMKKGVIVFDGASKELRESPVTAEKLGV